MKTLNKMRWIMGIVTMGVSLLSQAYPGESIVLDPVTGDYTITYWDPEEPAGLEDTTFVPATKIDPAIFSKFQLGDAGIVTYSYTVSNGAAAKQAIIGLSLEQTERVKGERDVPLGATATVSEVGQAFLANTSALNSPASWSGNIYRLRESRIVWRPDDLKTGGVQAGSTQAGFSFSSLALPGVSMARMDGIGAVFGYAGDGPAQDSAILAELNRLQDNDFIARPAAVPTIAVPTPFNAAVTLERIQTHVHSWIGMKLLDPAFSAQLDTSFKGAIDAYRSNQPKAGKSAIKSLRELLKKAYPDLDNEDIVDEETSNNKPVLSKAEGGAQFKNGMIARLPARVLDFDLKYVLKQVGEE